MEREPIEVFFSYSHEDEKLKDELVKHLSLLRRDKVIAAWHDRKIGAGDEWAKEIDSHLESAGIVLLLVSSDFLASDYCYDVEMKRAMERHERGDARVIPVILRRVDWSLAIFAKLKALPRDGTPVTSWPDRDEAFADIAAGIREEVDKLLAVRLNPLVEKMKKAVSLRNWPNVINIGERILSVLPNHELTKKTVARALIAKWYRDLNMRDFFPELHFFLVPKPAELVADVSKAIELDPTNADYYFVRSCLYLGDEEKNIEDLTRAIELSPQDAKHYYARALKVKSRDKASAERDFKRILELGFEPPKKPEEPARAPRPAFLDDPDLLEKYPFLRPDLVIIRPVVEGIDVRINFSKLFEQIKADLVKILSAKS